MSLPAVATRAKLERRLVLAYAQLMATPEAPQALDTLPQPLAVLKCRAEGAYGGPETTFYLLGTAHVSVESCEDVSRLIKAVKPQVNPAAHLLCCRCGGAARVPPVSLASFPALRLMRPCPFTCKQNARGWPPLLRNACATRQASFWLCRHPQPASLPLSPTTVAQVVLIELCAERKPILTADKIRQPSLPEVLGEIRAGRVSPFQGVYSW